MRLGGGHGLGGNPLAVFLRAEWRARWPAHLVLVAVAAVTIAAAVAPLTGAARSETAFHRLRAATRASDVIISLRAQSGDTVNGPGITSGRPVDPSRPDEVALSEHLAAALHVKVGDNLTLESMTAHWVDLANTGGDPGPPDGPRVHVKVIGLSRNPADFGRWKGVLHLAPAFVQRYGGRLNVYFA